MLGSSLPFFFLFIGWGLTLFLSKRSVVVFGFQRFCGDAYLRSIPSFGTQCLVCHGGRHQWSNACSGSQVVLPWIAVFSQRVFATSFMDRKAVVKERFSKKYRHPVLDSKLTSKRLLGVRFLACGLRCLYHRLLLVVKCYGPKDPVIFWMDQCCA